MSQNRSPLLFFPLLPGLARLRGSQTQCVLLLILARNDIDGGFPTRRLSDFPRRTEVGVLVVLRVFGVRVSDLG
jgi:hypothetical protein